MNDFLKIVQVLEFSSILLKRITKTIKNEAKEEKGGFLSMLLGTLGATLFSSGKGVTRTGYENKQGKGGIRAGYDSSIKKNDSTTSFNKL